MADDERSVHEKLASECLARGQDVPAVVVTELLTLIACARVEIGTAVAQRDEAMAERNGLELSLKALEDAVRAMFASDGFDDRERYAAEQKLVAMLRPAR